MSVSISSCKSSDDDVVISDSLTAVFNKVVNVTNVAGEVFYRCDSPEETKKYFNKILDTEGVVDVWINDLAMYVEIEDWGVVPYYFSLERPESVNIDDIKKLVAEATRANASFNTMHSHLPSKRVCIVNQLANDQDKGAEGYQASADAVEYMFNKCGFEAKQVSPTFDFFNEEMYGYDIVFLLSHGEYRKSDNTHWILTSDGKVMSASFGIDFDWLGKMFGAKYKDYPKDKVKFACHSESRGGIFKTPIYYVQVSDKFIEELDVNFRSDCKAIVFAPCCEGLKGSERLAEAFISRGAGAFVGYNETNNVGDYAGVELFYRMLGGMSLKNGLSDLPSKYQYGDYKGIKSKICAVYSKPEQNYCINGLTMSNIKDNSTENKIEFEVSAKMPLPMGLDASYLKPFQYGFIISETEDFKTGKAMPSMTLGSEGVTVGDWELTVSDTFTSVELKPETTYYIWPYIFDGTDLCAGDMSTITTGKLERINQVLPDNMRKQVEEYIPIYDGDTPPNVEGVYLIDPLKAVYDSEGYYSPGKTLSPKYIRFYNQDPATNTLDYAQKEDMSEGKGEGSFISGSGNQFTVFFNVEGVYRSDDYACEYKEAMVISGTRTDSGIKDLQYAFVMLEKGNDWKNNLMDVNAFRVFKDGDGLAASSVWPSGSRTRNYSNMLLDFSH